MGKMFTFTVEETRRFASLVREAIGGRMGLLVGAGGEWLNRERGEHAREETYVRQAIELTRFCSELGADAAVHVLPAAVEPRRGETHTDLVYRYYRSVHDATDAPIVLYQPGGMPEPYRLTAPLMARLMELPRIAGLKLSTTDDSVFSPIAEVVRSRPFGLICGHEGYYAHGLRQGAVGVIGQGCNGYPEILAAAEKRHYDGDQAGADLAMADVWAALRATDGLDSSVVLKQYFALHGFQIPPYDRSGTAPYDTETVEPVGDRLDALRAGYRNELGLEPFGRPCHAG
jgi:dihydrodipicolinate synthase/N-acetylneuraminate lyase